MTHHADKNPLDATQFPALRNFLRGYFHQDLKDEYGSTVGAARAFCKDASDADRAALIAEWSGFARQTAGMSLDQINRLLTGPLGSSYSLAEGDIPQISSILKAGAK